MSMKMLKKSPPREGWPKAGVGLIKIKHNSTPLTSTQFSKHWKPCGEYIA